MKEEYRIAFTEVNEIMKLMPIELINKIPRKFREMIEEEKDNNYIPDIKEPIEKCKLKNETIIILVLIYRDFLCSQDERKKLQEKDARELQKVKKDIEEGAKKLPVLVKGEKTGWVVAQVSPTHLRLTLVDGGYLAPMDRKVKVMLNNLSVKKVCDILDGISYNITDNSFDVTVPCGMFRFIDIELQKPFM